MSDPLVSIMMPAYNAAEYIGLAIESALAQTYKNWEMIIVNDGSTDETVQIVNSYQDSRIRLIQQENAGEAVARNTALKAMRGEWVAFLDSDDLWRPNHLELTVNYLLQNLDKDAVYTDGCHIDPQGHELQSLSSRRRGPFEGWIFEELVRASDVFGPPLCVVLRRTMIDDYNLEYDPRIVIGPDWDFFIRYAEFARFGYLDQNTCLYRVHLTNITVLTGMQKRAASLTICREKAIKLPGFARCSLETRSYVFYDLLVNLLTGYPERQEDILDWTEFAQLPVKERARILHLMASQAILYDKVRSDYPAAWLDSAHKLDAGNRTILALKQLHRVSPSLSRFFLKLRRGGDSETTQRLPLADIKLS
jgi:glycosyltransferase involved in cell wall biosynthesis